MTETKGDFYLEIKFKKDTENPSRIFKTMSDLINAFQEFDYDLIRGIDSKLEPVILLEDVETGSIRAWLVNKIKGIPDDIIKDGDYKKVLGHFLLKAKYILINRLEGYTEISDARIIQNIQDSLAEEAKRTNLKQFPHYVSLPSPAIIKNINNIQKSLISLNKENDAVIIHSQAGDAHFNLQLSFTPTDIEDLLTKERIENTTTQILKVKKPDYLGQSMWDFKYDGRLISAKIFHSEWLDRFQKRELDIRPGDSLKVIMKTVVKYGYDNEVVGQSYDILEIIDILPLLESQQGQLEF